MNKILDALLMAASDMSCREQWLGEAEKIRAYRQCVGRIETEHELLQSMLRGENLELVNRLADDFGERGACDEEIAFRQGLAAGIFLGTLALRLN